MLKKFYSLIFLIILIAGCSTQTYRSEGPQIKTSEPKVLKKYTAFYVPEIEVYSIEGDTLRRVDDREVEGLAVNFRSKIIRSLGSKHTPLSYSSSNVARINVAISDVSSTYALFQIYPGFIIPNALRGGASIEAKVLDSVSGKEVLSFKESRQGERQGFLSGLGKWDGLEKAFDEWAMQLSAAVSR